ASSASRGCSPQPSRRSAVAESAIAPAPSPPASGEAPSPAPCGSGHADPMGSVFGPRQGDDPSEPSLGRRPWECFAARCRSAAPLGRVPRCETHFFHHHLLWSKYPGVVADKLIGENRSFSQYV